MEHRRGQIDSPLPPESTLCRLPPTIVAKRWQWAALLVALLLAPVAYAQTASTPTISSINFRTGEITFNAGSCGGDVYFEYRHATIGSWTDDSPATGPTSPYTHTNIAGRDYVEVRAGRYGDSPACPTDSPLTTPMTYTAVTVASNPSPLDESNIDGAQLTVTLGADHAFGSGVTAASFDLIHRSSISGLSIASMTGGGSGTRTATLTLGSTASFSDSFDLNVRVHAAAHNGSGDLTSRVITSFRGLSVAPDSDYDTDDDGLIEISTLQQLNAVRWDLDGDASPVSGNATAYRTAFPVTSSGTMGCPATGCTGYELTRHLDFDTDGDGDVDSNDPNTYASWTRIAGTYTAIFDGNGFNIANLTYSGSADASLFQNVSGTIRWLGLPNVNIASGGLTVAALAAQVTSTGTVIGCWSTGTVTATRTSGSAYAAGLVYEVAGRLAASFSTADVRARTYAGGLADELASTGTIVASYATGSVRSQSVGSLVRWSRGTIRASYATGVPTDTSTQMSGRDPSCFVHNASGATNTDNYCDTDLAGLTTATGATGKTTSEMQTPTSATGIYADWDDLDVDGDGTADEDPWHFGTSSQHPVLKYGTQDPGLQRGGDYDNDDDGLIDIYSLRQLNAIRWDRDGDGAPLGYHADDYASAFYDHPADMGCPTSTLDEDDNDCIGYELDDDLDFDTDGDGTTHTDGTGDSGDAYYNGGTGWDPIGWRHARFTATFNGNGKVIANLFIGHYQRAVAWGLFGATGSSATITALGMEDANVDPLTGYGNAGAVVGENQGRVAACWATGTVSHAGKVGGIVGLNDTTGVLVASYSRALLSGSGHSIDREAGLAGRNLGVIRTSYSAGPIHGTRAGGHSPGTAVATYWDTDISGSRDRDSVPPEGRTTAELQGPTEYGTSGLYATWDDEDVDGDGIAGEAVDDDAWDFGTSSQHPVLKFAGFDTTRQFNQQRAILIDANPGTTNVDEPGPLALNELAGDPDNSKNYTVRLAARPASTVTVRVTSDDRAVTVSTGGTPQCCLELTFTTANWDTAQTVTATAAEDDDTQNESVTITHRGGGGGYTALSAELIAMTTDDDTPAIAVNAAALTTNGVTEGATATYTVALETQPESGVVVSIAASGGVSVDADGGQAGLQSSIGFHAGNWSRPRTVTVFGVEDDDGASGTATLQHTASGADYGTVPAVDVTFAVTDDDAPAVLVDALAGFAVNEGATATYSVVLATAPVGGPVTVAATSSATAAATVSPMALTFTAANWAMPQRVTVSGVPDSDSTDGSATITHAVSGGDYGAVSAVPVTVLVRDTDAAGVRIEPPSLALREGQSGSYRVRLNTQPAGDVTVTATSASTELAVDNDGTPQTRTLTFTTANWNVEQTVSVTVGTDDEADDEAIAVAHDVTGYAGVTSAPLLTVSVEDADAPEISFAPASGLQLSEAAIPSPGTVAEWPSARYTVVLTAEPTATVVVSIASDDAGLEFERQRHMPTGVRGVAFSRAAVTANEEELAGYTAVLTAAPVGGDVTLAATSSNVAVATVSPATRTFTTANWDVPQRLWVRGVDDADTTDGTATISHTVSGADYDGVSAATVAVAVRDSGAAGVRITPALALAEGGSASYSVRLNTQPSGTVTVTATSATTALAVDQDGTPQQKTLTFTTANWDTSQSVQVSAAADADGADETLTVTHAVTGYTGVTTAPALDVEVQDDEMTFTTTNWNTAQTVTVRPLEDGDDVTETATLLHTAWGGGYDGVSAGYAVRLLDADARRPPTPVVGGGGGGIPAGRAPEVATELPEVALAVGETLTVDLAGAFVDPDGGQLRYMASSSDPAVATVETDGSQLLVRGNRTGTVEVVVRAIDPDGLQATQQLRVTVGGILSLAPEAEAPEGGTARLVAQLLTPRTTATTFSWSVAADMDAATVDADAGEHGGASGEATIAAGETSTEIAIAIADDDDIEPAREWFDVVLEAPADGCCVVREARARVAVLEGVCDRTPAVADALRRDAACTAPTPATLATRTSLTVSGAEALRIGDFQGLPNLRRLVLSGNAFAALPEDVFAGLGLLLELDLSGNALATLPSDPFSGLSRLRLLDLSGNALETLPAGLFAGLFLREASVADNPGAPFPLAGELARTDAEPWAPGPATVEVRLPSGAPFPLRLALTAEPAQETLPAMVAIPAGATAAVPFAASAPAAGALVLRVGAATLPAATCGEEWPFRACFRGLVPQPSATLTLFRQPPRALSAPEPDPLAGDTLRLPLTSLIAAGDGAPRWQASSSDESVATVRVVGGDLLVEPELGAEGTVEVVLVATDAVGLTATVRFTVQVEFFAPTRPNVGWRSALGELARQ